MIKRYLSWLRTNSRGVDPETGQRFAPPFWTLQPNPEPSLAFSALVDWPVIGIDVSKWQGVMNWEVALSRGISFAIIRSSYYAGGLYEDPQYQRNVSECERLGIPYGVYHYIIPYGTPATQANYFADRVRGPLGAWMDVEDNGGYSSAALADWLWLFADTLTSRLGKLPGIYTRASFWNTYVADRDWERFKLWIARYDATITNPYPPYTPRDWPGEHDWSIWQWSAGGNGLGAYYGAQSADIDLNRYDGTLEDFKTEFDLEDAGDEPPDDEIIYLSAGYTYHIEPQADVIIRRLTP